MVEQKTELEIINEKISNAKIRLGEYEQELSDYWLSDIKENFGIYIGKIVMYKGKRAKIIKINATSYSKKPWVNGNIEKKDGTFSARDSHLYDDWEVI